MGFFFDVASYHVDIYVADNLQFVRDYKKKRR